MTDFYFQVVDSWAVSFTSQEIGDGGTHTSGALTIDGEEGAVISVVCGYGASGTAEGIKVYIAGEGGDGTYQVIADEPFGIQLPTSASTTHRSNPLRVLACDYPKLKILVGNDSGDTATVSAYYKTYKTQSS